MGLQGRADHRRIVGPVLHPCRTWSSGNRRSRLRADAEQRLCTTFPARPPGVVRACRAGLPDASRRVQPHVLHELGVRVDRYGDQDHPCLPARPRTGAAEPSCQPRARLSRRQYGWRFPCRYGSQPRDIRADTAEHLDDPAHLDRGTAVLKRPAKDRRRTGDGSGADRRESRRRNARRGIHRAGGRLDRNIGAAGG